MNVLFFFIMNGGNAVDEDILHIVWMLFGAGNIKDGIGAFGIEDNDVGIVTGTEKSPIFQANLAGGKRGKTTDAFLQRKHVTLLHEIHEEFMSPQEGVRADAAVGERSVHRGRDGVRYDGAEGILQAFFDIF